MVHNIYVYILHGNDEALGWVIFVMYKLQSDIKENQDPHQNNKFLKKQNEIPFRFWH